MSHAGDANLRTPALDALAAAGVSFRRAYANCPVCTPSRGTIFSGRHAHAGPVAGFFDVYKATAPSLATELRRHGYHTAYFGKWHCGIVQDQRPAVVREDKHRFPGGSRHRTPEWHRAGFQDWVAFENLNKHFDVSVYRNDALEPERLEGYETDVLTEEALRYLREYRREQPLFLVLSVTPPHFPLIVPDRWKRWDPATLQVPPNFREHPVPPSAGNSPSPWGKEHPGWAPASMRQALADYYAMIENLDWNIGRLSAALTETNAVFSYISDHGEFLGSHGLCERKEHPHEEGVRVPALFHWPGHVAARGLTEGLFGLVDFAPTLLGLVGASAPAWMQGRDFSPLLCGEPFTPPDLQLLEMVQNPRWNLDYLDWRGLVTEHWKYAYYETGHELLFDLRDDPWEQHNLASHRPDLCAEWRTRLLAELRATREPFFDVLLEHGAPCAPARNASGLDYQIVGWPTRKENAP
jgi:arylsulfatase A-like enzyme